MIDRLNIYNGLIITLVVILPLTWICRSRVTLPDIGGEKMFSVRDVSVAEGMADIKLHASINGERQLLAAGFGDVDLDMFESDGSGLGKKNRGAFAPSAPMGAPSRRRNAGDSENNGLFGAGDIDFFSGKSLDPDSSSWGWLADDIKSASRDTMKSDNKLESRRDTRRLFNDNDDSFGRSFGSERNSSDDSFFHRQRELR